MAETPFAARNCAGSWFFPRFDPCQRVSLSAETPQVCTGCFRATRGRSPVSICFSLAWRVTRWRNSASGSTPPSLRAQSHPRPPRFLHGPPHHGHSRPAQRLSRPRHTLFPYSQPRRNIISFRVSPISRTVHVGAIAHGPGRDRSDDRAPPAPLSVRRPSDPANPALPSLDSFVCLGQGKRRRSFLCLSPST